MSTNPTSPDEVVTSFIQAIERLDLDAACELLADDVIYDNVPIGAVQGPEGVRSTLGDFFGASEVDWPVARQTATGNVVMNERLDRFKLDTGWLELPVVGVFEVEDALITLWRDYFDLGTFRSALKALNDTNG